MENVNANVSDPMEKLHQRERETERRRLREEQQKDQEVEGRQGTRPLEGYAGGHTTWASQQDDRAAAQEYGQEPEAAAPVDDAEEALAKSNRPW